MNLDCKYYMLGDDDHYIFIKNILKYLNKKNHNALEWFGRDINNEKFGYWGDTELKYCGGCTTTFTQRSFKVLAEYIKNNFDQVANDNFSDYADVCIGYICKYNDIKLIQDDRFHTVSYADHTPCFHDDEFFDEKCVSLLADMFNFHYIRDPGTINFIKKYYEEA